MIYFRGCNLWFYLNCTGNNGRCSKYLVRPINVIFGLKDWHDVPNNRRRSFMQEVKWPRVCVNKMFFNQLPCSIFIWDQWDTERVLFCTQ